MVEVEGLDGDYLEQSEFVITNGAGTRNLTKSYLRINTFHSMLVGTDGAVSSGTILLEDQATGLVTYSQVTVGGNMSLVCHYTVPVGKTMYITDWSASASGTKPILVILRATVDLDDRARVPGVFLYQDNYVIEASAVFKTFSLPLKVPGKSDVKTSARALSVSGEAAASIGFWLE